MVATAELQDIVFAAMSAANLNRPDDAQMAIGPEAPIFGPGSPLDSLGLVSLLMDIEDGLAQLGINVTLSDARAMSRKRSPFRDVPELVTFMTELLREAA
jgi:acyl carrier protein